MRIHDIGVLKVSDAQQDLKPTELGSLLSGKDISMFNDVLLCLPSKLIYRNLIPNVMVFGVEVFEKSLGHEGGDFMNKISALIK